MIATWYVERAIRFFETSRARQPEEEVVLIEDLIPGWQPVVIGLPYDE